MKRSGVADLPLHGDDSLNFLRSSLDKARLGDKDKLEGFRRLERFVRTIETELEPEAHFGDVIAHENAISPSLNGRSVFADKPRRVLSSDFGVRLL